MEEPRKVSYYSAINKYAMIMGCDRRFFLSIAFLSAILIFSIRTWYSAGMGLLLWTIGIPVLKRMGKADPLMVDVVLAHLRNKDFYPGGSGLNRMPMGAKDKL